MLGESRARLRQGEGEKIAMGEEGSINYVPIVKTSTHAPKGITFKGRKRDARIETAIPEGSLLSRKVASSSAEKRNTSREKRRKSGNT